MYLIRFCWKIITMGKCLKICVFLLTGLVFITGCPERDSGHFEKKEVLTSDIEPSVTELLKNEPAADIQVQEPNLVPIESVEAEPVEIKKPILES